MSCCCGRMMKCFKHAKGTYDLPHTQIERKNTPPARVVNNPIEVQPIKVEQPVQPEKIVQASTPTEISVETVSNSAIPPPINPRKSNFDTTEIHIEIERRAGIPLQPRNVEEKLDQVEIIKHSKDKETEEMIHKSIMRNEFLRYILDDNRLQQCIDAMYSKTFAANEYVITEGDTGSHLYVSVEGSFEVTKGGMIVFKFKDGVTFGELAILYNTKRFASVQAMTKAKVWVLDRLVYQKIMVRSVMEEHEANKHFMRNVSLFKDVPEVVLEKVSNLLKKEFFETGAVIVRQGDRGDKFYLIKVGSVLVTKRTSENTLEETVGIFKKGEVFGELALLKEDCRQATVTAQAPGVECLTLDRNNFIQHLGSVDELNNIDYHKQSTVASTTQRKTEYSYISLDDLDVIATLGVGGFGRVELVRYRADKKLTFALKYLKKLDMVQQQQQEHAYNEKMIMMTCDSDFICKLYNTYRDDKYLYFLMEVCLGGDIWTILQKQKSRCFEEKTAKFMSACVIEALDYLHTRQIVYRDLKPENLLLDSQGYIKLVDFGFAKILGPRGKTFTFAGTPEYVAPEIINNRGHDKAVDYWALGILIHELLIGKPPFRGSDHMKTYSLIIRGIDAVELPDKLSKNAKMLIRRLCRSVPSDRLGCQRNGMDGVRTNKWFDKFNWEQLQSRQMPAPLKPKIKDNSDMSNFDKYPNDNDIPPDETSGWDKDF